MFTSRKLLPLLLSAVVVMLFIQPAFSASSKRFGETFRSKSVEISAISSKKLEKNKTGLIWYAVKAKVRNRTNRPIKVTVIFQALDREGFEIEDVYFSNKLVKRNSTLLLADKEVMDAYTYKNIWEWKVKKVRVKKLSK